jgi:hypothetical protein
MAFHNGESGVHIKAVADLLGHSSIAITGDVYGHTSDDTARAAVDGWSGVLGRAPLRYPLRYLPPGGTRFTLAAGLRKAVDLREVCSAR